MFVETTIKLFEICSFKFLGIICHLKKIKFAMMVNSLRRFLLWRQQNSELCIIMYAKYEMIEYGANYFYVL